MKEKVAYIIMSFAIICFATITYVQFKEINSIKQMIDADTEVSRNNVLEEDVVSEVDDEQSKMTEDSEETVVSEYIPIENIFEIIYLSDYVKGYSTFTELEPLLLERGIESVIETDFFDETITFVSCYDEYGSDIMTIFLDADGIIESFALTPWNDTLDILKIKINDELSFTMSNTDVRSVETVANAPDWFDSGMDIVPVRTIYDTVTYTDIEQPWVITAITYYDDADIPLYNVEYKDTHFGMAVSVLSGEYTFLEDSDRLREIKLEEWEREQERIKAETSNAGIYRMGMIGSKLPTRTGNIYYAPLAMVGSPNLGLVGHINVLNPSKLRHGCSIQIVANKDLLGRYITINHKDIDRDTFVYTAVDVMVID